ncbi:MAG: nuclear transport factor 2 family protein [Flavobacteriaceae bacterium]|nr:nuclear transport factor 2 family protein [Flavobacteriaceae bacterium]
MTTFLIFISVTSKISGQGINNTHKDSLNTIVEKYYELNLKIFQANSKLEDIDNIFNLFTDDFVYIHPKYGGTYTRKNLFNGYIRNQKNGGYDGSVIDIKIVNKIIGLNAVTIEKRFIKKEKGEIVEGKSEMTLFEFRNGKIFKIFEYW